MAQVEIQHDGAVAVLTINRPPINVLDESALNELSAAVQDIEADSTVRAVIVASSIRGVFCAGGDLKYWPRAYRNRGDLVSAAGRKVFAQMKAWTKPSIAAIRGRVIGDGLSLALACDLRIADQTTTLQLPEIRYGFIPGWGTIGRLVETVGRSVASEIVFLGEPIDAPKAHDLRLVNWVTNSEKLWKESLAIAEKLAARGRQTLHYAKAVLRGRPERRKQDHVAWEAACFEAVWGNDEWKHGLKSLGFL